MESFSQRKGLKPIKSIMQVDSMDDDLRNGLWNALTTHYWSTVKRMPHSVGYHLSSNPEIRTLVWQLWVNHFKKPVDTIGNDWREINRLLKKYFFDFSWNEVYDLVEFVANNYPTQNVNSEFMAVCNIVLKREMSAYRFVGNKITQITSEEEIAEIEEAMKQAPNPVIFHLKTALHLFSDRKSPDYRNSIKESISAVESICKLIASDPKADLEQALKEIEKQTKLHPALKKSFCSLYGYASDSNGIRHALMDESDLDFEDAKFMLVSCSTFINYLITKASKAGIKL